MNLEDWEERAAILEYDEGLPRFKAETIAAHRQGYERWEFINAIKQRDSETSGNNGKAGIRDTEDKVPGVQPSSEEEKRSMPKRNLQAGWNSVVLLALFIQWGQVL